MIQIEEYSIIAALFAKTKDWKKVVLIGGEPVKCIVYRALRQG